MSPSPAWRPPAALLDASPLIDRQAIEARLTPSLTSPSKPSSAANSQGTGGHSGPRTPHWRITCRDAGPRELVALRQILAQFPFSKFRQPRLPEAALSSATCTLKLTSYRRSRTSKAPSPTNRRTRNRPRHDRSGFKPNSMTRNLSQHSNQIIAAIGRPRAQAHRYRFNEIRFNHVFGYYIEIFTK